ncbi:phosphoribosyl-AMP cyclohydrolase [Corticibacter populi]|uniref:Phosphoribosyl-AMP cyclohydrolase n=1 Tax=Corticibacter populi TaxID=1550736 RepID=A0A3M6QYZ8_9BURK|nr:phosphoribosyl-AMP cyclohydrolase [Corticibacter populi]RMX08244.1 phosphoribosyl-AMP cyclohydrolase [Corticibacter populi]RZS35517.1 phosphoribosyl-AMP cyclohydrolase [Corticibacter populi]
MSQATSQGPLLDVQFAPRLSIDQVEEGQQFAPKFDAHGLIACVTTDATSGEVLMLGYMNRDALKKTIQTGEAHYWSRSRQVLWHKGATSGLVQKIREIRVDDDQDAIWLRVDIDGGASCHVGYRSCFYRIVPHEACAAQPLVFAESKKVFDPVKVYGDAPNHTQL